MGNEVVILIGLVLAGGGGVDLHFAVTLYFGLLVYCLYATLILTVPEVNFSFIRENN